MRKLNIKKIFFLFLSWVLVIITYAFRLPGLVIVGLGYACGWVKNWFMIGLDEIDFSMDDIRMDFLERRLERSQKANQKTANDEQHISTEQGKSAKSSD